MGLNEAGHAIAEQIAARSAELAVASERRGGVLVIDCGVRAAGSDQAGLAMARAALGGAGEVWLVPPAADTPAGAASDPESVAANMPAWPGCPWPTVGVSSNRPVAACLAAQYAGWKVARDDYFAMASGPIRAAIGREPLFDTICLREAAPVAVGLLESGRLPPAEVCRELARDARVAAEQVCLLVARTASPAGTLQVVARSLETALHKLHDLGFDLARIRCGSGTAPLPPVAADDLTAIGRTNDAILYGGRVVLEVTGDDSSLAELGPRAVSLGSPAFGSPFLAVFEAAGRDFYAIDPALFAPARLEMVNVETGCRHTFGGLDPDLVAGSFSGSGSRTPAGR